MREIKFRAWSKESNYLLSWREVLDYIKDVGIGIFTDSNFNLMQYTGLKDKNGKEIYEGDIVKAKFRYDTDKEDKPAKNSAKFEVQYKIDQHCQFCGFSLFPSDFSTIEVIGNIYENPYLIKEVINE